MHTHCETTGNTTAGGQLDLFASRLPPRPYCANDLSQGLHQRGRTQALQLAHVQANRPALFGTLVFDVDYEGAAFGWERYGAPPPSWIASNPANGHAHLAYGIVAPVVTSDLARVAPLRYLHSVQQAMTDRLHADPAYAHFICKNPVWPGWRVIDNGIAYELGDFAEWVDLRGYPRRCRAAESQGLGRNVTLFDSVRARAYRMVAEYRLNGDADRWHAAILDYANERNVVFAVPLHASEVASVARSVSKWTWRNFGRGRAHAVFIERQTTKAKIGGKKRREAAAQAIAMAICDLHVAGRRITVSAIARVAGVSRQTVYTLRRELGDDLFERPDEPNLLDLMEKCP